MDTRNPTGTSARPNVEAVDELNSLLRGELSAVETYEQALSKVDEYPAAMQEVRRIRDEHRDASQTLREHVTKFGGTPSTGSGVWGDFAGAVTGAAKLVGPDTTLAALKTGEEHGIRDYESALKKDALPAECKELVRGTLLPKCRAHVAALDSVRSFLK